MKLSHPLWPGLQVLLLCALFSRCSEPEDTIPPDVSITNPSNNATVTGTITVRAIATDNQGIDRLDFFVNGALRATVSEIPYEFEWNTEGLVDGQYSLTAGAFDLAGNSKISDPVVVNIKDEIIPVVSIISPQPDSEVSGVVQIRVNATDNNAVEKVEFVINGVLENTDLNSPWQYDWDTRVEKPGEYTVQVIAYDEAINSASSSIDLTVLDIIAPEVTILKPESEIDLYGRVDVRISASDNDKVDRIDFSVDNQLEATDFSLPWEFSWNVAVLPRGEYTISVKAFDPSGNSTVEFRDVRVGDFTNPEIEITAPEANETITGITNIMANVTDENGVNEVKFFVANDLISTDQDSPFQAIWDPSNLSDGNYEIKVEATDQAGNFASKSIIVSLEKPDLTDPTVEIVSPIDGSLVSGIIDVTVTASDNKGVASVELFVNGSLHSTDFSAPWGFDFNTDPYVQSTVELVAKAYDATGNSATSSEVSIHVFIEILLDITNQLLRPVIVTLIGEEYFLDAQDNEQFLIGLYAENLILEWDILKTTTTGGEPVGDDIGAFFIIDGSSTSVNIIIDNIVENQRFFFPSIDNKTSAGLLMAVNWELQAQNKCYCVAPANQLTSIGYYLLYSNTIVVGFKQSSGYTGNYIGWSDFSTHVVNPTGAITLSVTTGPSGTILTWNPPNNPNGLRHRTSDIEDVMKVEGRRIKGAIMKSATLKRTEY